MALKPTPHTLKVRIGDSLTRLIEREQITQKIVADDMGVALNTIGRICNAVNGPSLELLDKLADYFDTTTDEVMGRTQ